MPEPSQKSSKRITLADVAAKAGVSVQTASHVMAENLTVRLPAATRERVKDAANTLGYEPNRIARAMKTGKTNMVSVWMPVDRPNYFFLRSLREISRVTRQSGYDLMIVGLESAQAYGEQHRLPHQWPVDGLMSLDAGRAMKLYREKPGNTTTPLVVFGLESFEYADTVSWDVKGSVESTINRFIQSGLKRIVHLTPDWIIERFPIEQRRTGYRLAMESNGLEPVLLACPGESSNDGFSAMEKYLESNPPPEMVFCFLDSIGIGAIRALTAAGLSVPQDCQVLGFSNSPDAEDSRIPMSSIGVQIVPMIERGWELLSARINNPNITSTLEVFDMEFVERSSTRIS